MASQVLAFPSPSPAMEDRCVDLPEFPLEKQNRTASEWETSVLAYLEFRAGSRWRAGKARLRHTQEHDYYLDALRLVTAISRIEPPPCECRYCTAANKHRREVWADIRRCVEACA